MEENLAPHTSIKREVKLHEHLRRERELRGWSQATVAEKIGAQLSLVNRWENGVVFPGPHYREKLCLLFEKDAQTLGLIKEKKTDLSPSETTHSPLVNNEIEPKDAPTPVINQLSEIKEALDQLSQTVTQLGETFTNHVSVPVTHTSSMGKMKMLLKKVKKATTSRIKRRVLSIAKQNGKSLF